VRSLLKVFNQGKNGKKTEKPEKNKKEAKSRKKVNPDKAKLHAASEIACSAFFPDL